MSLILGRESSIPIVNLPKPQAQTGETVIYTLNYEVLIDTASSIIIDDAIPSGSAYVGGSATGGGQFDGTKVIWNLGNLDPGSSGSVQFQVRAE